MRQIFIATLLTLSTFSLRAQASVEAVAQTQHFEFHINYWFNMHHFLWTEAFLNVHADSSLVEGQLSSEERAALNAAVNFYKENLVGQDLRSGDYMGAFREWIIDQRINIREIPDNFSVHMKHLLTFDGVYRTQFWSMHRNACEVVLSENLELIKTTEQAYVSEIEKLTRQRWQGDPIRVDITYFGKISKRNMRNRPYTNIFPTHVVMNTLGDNDIKGGWLELLYHEAAHHLILGSSYFVSGTINDVAEINKLDIPRQLWHAYLFYLTGKLTQQILTEKGVDYPYTYMERNGIFSNQLPVLEEHLGAYMQRKITLADATLKILQALADGK